MVNITYKYNDLEEARALTNVVDQKLEMLGKFVDDGIPVLCEVEFKKEGAHQNGKVFHVAVNTTVNGAMYRAEATENSFEEALDEVRNELDKELRRAKGKQQSMLKRAGRKMKEAILG